MGRDGLAYTVNSLHLRSCVTPGQSNAMDLDTTYIYYWQRIVAIVFIVLANMAVTSDCIGEE